MPVKIQKRLKALAALENGEVREEFKKNIDKSFGKQLLDLILEGVNPIKGLAGKQPQYSDSYKKQIEGKLAFRRGKHGNVYAVEPDNIESSNIKFDKKTGKYKRTSINQNNTFAPGLGVGKRKSPVNLKLTGELHKSLEIDISGENPRVTFTDEKAYYHNNEGVGPNKVKRRLLPDQNGEEFTLRLFQKILQALQDAIKKKLL